MVKGKYPRIEVSQRTYDLLSLESIFVNKTIKEIIDELVENHITKNTKLVLDQRMTSAIKKPAPSEDINIILGTRTKGHRIQKKQKLPLHKNISDQQRIANLYRKGMAVRKISREVGLSEGTIRRFIKKQIAEGELQAKPRANSTT